MDSDAASDRSLRQAVEALEQQVRCLANRLEALEASQHDLVRQAHPAGEDATIVPEDLIAAISAAIAAFLGVKPHIRQIQLVSGATWTQQGRVTIQASHVLAVRHD